METSQSTSGQFAGHEASSHVGPVRQDTSASRHAVAYRPGRCWRPIEIESQFGGATGRFPTDGIVVAEPLSTGGCGRPAEGGAATRASQEDRRQEGGGDLERDAQDEAARRDALEHAHDGSGAGGQCSHGATYGGGSWPAAPPCQGVQAELRSGVRRQAARCSGTVLEPTGQGCGAGCKREESDPGTGPHGAGAAIATRASREADARLYPARHDDSVCRPQRSGWDGHRYL